MMLEIGNLCYLREMLPLTKGTHHRMSSQKYIYVTSAYKIAILLHTYNIHMYVNKGPTQKKFKSKYDSNRIASKDIREFLNLN